MATKFNFRSKCSAVTTVATCHCTAISKTFSQEMQVVFKPRPQVTYNVGSFKSIFCYNQLQSAWDTVPYFVLNGLSMILCLWSPLHPFSKLLAIQDHAQNLENNFEWEGGGRSVFYLTDLWLAAIWSKKGCVFVRVSQHFCNWLSESFIPLLLWCPIIKQGETWCTFCT